MKRLLSLALLAAAAFFAACNKDDGHTFATPSPLAGIWLLLSSKQGFTGNVQQYEYGRFTWTFNEQNHVLVVYNGSEQNYVPLAAGNYTYTEAQQQGCDALTAGQQVFGCLTIANDTLTINNSYADGDILTLKKAAANE